ncbi:HAD family phosphatase [Streptosporangium sp. NPDC051023]|uniref:HAD family hydrolase n=1 Tax=Streptosporangium sp. NPDC051023 TaxID=3155410 RepID=UPI00344CBA01
MSAELHAVLFDMDGTVVDTEGLWRQACAAVAAELGLEAAEVDAGHVHGRPAEHTATHLVHLVRRSRDAPAEIPPIPGGPATSPRGEPARPKEALTHSIGGEPVAPGETSVARVSARLTEEFARRIAGGVIPLPGAIRLLDDLGAAGVPTALVTASSRRIVDLVLRTVGVARFRLVVAAEDTVRGKPSPDPYLRATAELGVDPARCVAVEDSPVGLAAALAAGCRAVSVSGDPAVPYGVLSVNSLEKIDVELLRLLAADKISIG